MVLLSWRTEQFGEDGFQGIRPHLIAPGGRMKFIPGVHHAFDKRAARSCQLVVDVQKADSPAVGQSGQVGIDLVDGWHHGHIVVAREDPCQNDSGVRLLCLQDTQDCLEPAGDIGDFSLIALSRNGIADIVGAGEQDDGFGIDSVELFQLASSSG